MYREEVGFVRGGSKLNFGLFMKEDVLCVYVGFRVPECSKTLIVCRPLDWMREKYLTVMD